MLLNYIAKLGTYFCFLVCWKFDAGNLRCWFSYFCVCRYKALKDLKDEILKRHMNFKEMASGLVLLRNINFSVLLCILVISYKLHFPMTLFMFVS